MNFFKPRFFFPLFFLLPGLTQAAATDSLKQFVKEAHSLRGNFTQTVLDKNARPTQKSSGAMQFQRPGKFRWAYQKPYEQLIVGDGAKVWLYDADLNQVTVRKMSDALGASPAALLAGGNAIERDFSLTEIGLQGALEWLEAKPKNKESSFDWMRIGFSKEGALAAMELRDHFGQTTVLQFSALEKNPVFTAETFRFVPPKGADVMSD